jgi:hypothetical protein
MSLTDAETAELAELQKKCLKNDGSPKANAKADDLKRLDELKAKMDVPEDDKQGDGNNGKTPLDTPAEGKKIPPLTDAETAELCKLETMCLNSEPYPFAQDMKRLAQLRPREHDKLKTVICKECGKKFVFVTTKDNVVVCPHCTKQTVTG